MTPVPPTRQPPSAEGGPDGRPSLPAGYQSQLAWAYRDEDGGLYEFNRVFGPPAAPDSRGEVATLDEGRSYWSVIWPISGEPGAQHPPGSWLTYEQARKAPRSNLTFAQFSSIAKMQKDLPRLMRGPA
jgi:hypothetical protein